MPFLKLRVSYTKTGRDSITGCEVNFFLLKPLFHMAGFRVRISGFFTKAKVEFV